MKRAALTLIAGVALAAVLMGAGGAGSKEYTVAAIFDNASGLIPGQNVEIAGAVVGKVSAIRLTPEHRARVEMKVQTGFAPFRADAGCEIKPQSLIGEKFVACDPGTPDAKQLRDVAGTPTIPLARNHSPVDIDLVFAALREPYVNRLSLIVNELGTGMAGRPHDLQQAIRRAAPALQESDRVLKIVNRDRAMLGRLIDRTDTVLAQVEPRKRDVTRFIDHASRAATDVAQRRDKLAAALDRLPPLLDELEPSARSLASTVRDARPVVHQLREATPSLRALFNDLAPLTKAGRPALSALESASDEGRRAVKVARPVAARLNSASDLIPHVAQAGSELTDSLRKTGAPEMIDLFAWLGVASMARFDATSHIVPSYQVSGLCNQYATTPVEGCSAHWPGSPAAKAVAVKEQKQARKHRRRHHRAENETPAAEGPAAEQPNAGAPLPTDRLPKIDLPPLPDLPDLPGLQPPKKDDSADKLLDFLLGK